MNHDSSDPSPNESAASSRRSTRETLDDLSRTLTDAIRNGGRDARRAFDEGLPKVKSEFCQGLHEVAYAVGYAATFGSAFLREATPDSVRNGFREGATSGRRAADEILRQRREKAEREERAATSGEAEAWV